MCVCMRVCVHPSSHVFLSLPATVCTVCCWCRECAVCPDGTFSDRVRQCMLLWQRGDSSHPALPFCHRCHRCHHCSVWRLLLNSRTTAFPPFCPFAPTCPHLSPRVDSSLPRTPHTADERGQLHGCDRVQIRPGRDTRCALLWSSRRRRWWPAVDALLSLCHMHVIMHTTTCPQSVASAPHPLHTAPTPRSNRVCEYCDLGTTFYSQQTVRILWRG